MGTIRENGQWGWTFYRLGCIESPFLRPRTEAHRLFIVVLPAGLRLVNAAAESNLVTLGVGEDADLGVEVVTGLGRGEGKPVYAYSPAPNSLLANLPTRPRSHSAHPTADSSG